MTYHHPSEHFPEPEGGWVFESPYVDTVMAFGEEAVALDKAVKNTTHERFGYGLHDFVQGQFLANPEAVAETVMDADPDAWASVVRSSLIMVQGSEDERQLIERLNHLGAVVTMWRTDVTNRTTPGVR